MSRINDEMKESLKKFFIEGKDLILKGIEADHPNVLEFIENRGEDELASIEIELFIKLIEKYWFKEKTIPIEMTVSKLSLKEKNEFVTISARYISEELVTLFETIFPINFEYVQFVTAHNTIVLSQFPKRDLFFYCFHKFFHDSIIRQKEIDSIIDDLISQWHEFINNHKIFVRLIIKLNSIIVEKKIDTDTQFQFIEIKHDIVKDLYLLHTTNSWSFCFICNAEFNVKVYNSHDDSEKNKDDSRSLFIEYSKIYKNIENFLCALYQNGYRISNVHPVVELPWWWEPMYMPYEQLDLLNYPFNDFIKQRSINTNEFKATLITYSKMIEKEFFNNKCYPLTHSLKELALKKKDGIDKIFDSHILLEYLFGPGFQGELNFRVALNSSLFISKNFEEFEKNFTFFKELYNIRSGAIHGGDWNKIADKSIKKLKNSKIVIEDFFGLIQLLESNIRIIIDNLLNQEMTLLEFHKNVNNDPLFFLRMSSINRE